MTSASTPALHPAESHDAPWWRHAVIYQIYPRSWADGNADGTGDLPGITARLPYLRDLGVDAVWLSPCYVSPMADAGYDVADFTDIDPVFGTLADADALIVQAHELGIRVIMDIVPNHSSDEHAWFQAALAAGPGSPERARYLFRDGTGPRGAQPPNNWHSVFGGPAWTRVTESDGRPGQWYLHLFDRKQPDFDWSNPEVHDFFLDVLRFWLDRGVDGFRVDVAHGLVKADGLPDWDEPIGLLGSPAPDEPRGRADDGDTDDATDDQATTAGDEDSRVGGPMWDQDGVHEIYRAWRKLLDSYNAAGDPARDRILCAEAWVPDPERAAAYVRADEMHQAFNFAYLDCPWRAAELREVITASLRAADVVGAPTTWVLSNHDVVRHVSRLGLPVGPPRPNGIGFDDPQPNAALGLRRARAATALMLGLPGSAYLYQGEELGLPDHTALPDEVRQDPTWERSGHAERGRDGCRVPIPWEAGATAYGFGQTWDTWLPQPELYAHYAVDRQDGLAGSTLELYRDLLRVRRDLDLGVGELAWLDGLGEDVVAFSNTDREGHRVIVVANLGSGPVQLPPHREVLVSTVPPVDGRLPTEATAWLRA